VDRLPLKEEFMTMKKGAVALIAAALMGGSAFAHHNMSALFDINDHVTVTGTLTKLDWRNPHVYLFVDMKHSDGQVQTWSLEGPSPAFFRNREINKSDFETAIGGMVTAEGSRARDGSPAALLRVITLPGGKLVSACPQNC